MTTSTPVTALLIGAGHRGRSVYGNLARTRLERLRIVAVAEPDPERRSAAAREHRISLNHTAADWREILELRRFADIAIIATSDTAHVEPALQAFARGYHVLLEKPMAVTAEDCLRLVEAAEGANRMLQVGHVLRYTPFYSSIYEVVSSGRLGRLIHVSMQENVAYWHMAHSFVRGKFRNRAIAAPLILAKCCHDLDLMAWYVGSKAMRVSSFGSLAEFSSANAPPDAPMRCTEGCPTQASCQYDAVRFYLGPTAGSVRSKQVEEHLAKSWPRSDVSLNPSRGARQRALELGPYGRCVYHCDNDIIDHQVVQVEFEGGVTGSFTVHGHATRESRTIRISGSRGELRGVLEDGVIEVSLHGSPVLERYEIDVPKDGHYGGDDALVSHFIDVVFREASGEILASGRAALESHLIGFAAEESRLTGTCTDMSRYREEIARRLGGQG